MPIFLPRLVHNSLDTFRSVFNSNGIRPCPEPDRQFAVRLRALDNLPETFPNLLDHPVLVTEYVCRLHVEPLCYTGL